MSKINKYANLYDKDGNLLRRVNESGILPNYTIEELEELVDQLAADKDEDGKVRNPQALNNANSILLQMYYKYGNPHQEEIMAALRDKYDKKTTKEAISVALNDVLGEVESNSVADTPDNEVVMERPETIMDEYIEPITE